jgi:N-acetylglucosamine kinase-like BadF-type ATPase
MSRIYLGADVGGTKTAVGVARDDEIIARAAGPGAAVRPGRALASATAILDVARQALAEARCSRADAFVVGAAGAGRSAERDELYAAIRSEGVSDRLRVTTDVELALAAAFGDAEGIVVTAGTGSIAVGRDASGATHRIGGYGWQMGDEGSGYAIGRAALGAVGRAADGRSPRTALVEPLLAGTRSADLDALIRWAAGATPAEVAGLAPTVLQVAAGGDTVAQGIADYAARELSQLAVCLLPHLTATRPVRVALTGGLLGAERPLRRAVLARLRETPELAPIEPPIDAVLGALALARKLV